MSIPIPTCLGSSSILHRTCKKVNLKCKNYAILLVMVIGKARHVRRASGARVCVGGGGRKAVRHNLNPFPRASVGGGC